ncbi:MAG: sodium:solute symporter family protein [Haliangium ochraceum]
MHPVDITIIALYMAMMVAVGWIVMRLAARSPENYFLAGKSLPWWVIGVAHGSSGIDVSGTMWFVMMLFIYGTKAAWLLWIWPLFNVVFRMVYLGPWVRRSNVLTGAEWMRTRFGSSRGGELAYVSVVIYALVSVTGYLSYAFRGIGKFVIPFLPWNPRLDLHPLGWHLHLGPADIYGTVILAISGAYCVAGGMYGVVLNDIIQYALILASAIIVAVVAMSESTRQSILDAVPAGWDSLFPSWKLNYDWASRGLPALNDVVNQPFPEGHGYSFFMLFVGMLFFRGVLVSLAGPTPNYTIQHILSTKSPREAALENMWMAVVSLGPRFLLIGGITVLGLLHSKADILKMGTRPDFEQILPGVVQSYVPTGAKGLIIAGLLAAFMSTFVSTVNSGVAYIVNDVYRRYVNPAASPRRLVRLGYVYSVALILAGIGFGFLAPDVNHVTRWIADALVVAFVVPNAIKWHWWRFNGYGFCAGMMAGTLAAVVALVLPPIRSEYTSLGIIAVSGVASIGACLLTRPDEMSVLKTFYRTVRPWGFWGPVERACAAAQDPVAKNPDFARDTFNVVVGMVWQMAMVATPIYFVIKDWAQTLMWLAILIATCAILKRTWYDHLGPGEMYMTADGQPPPG